MTQARLGLGRRGETLAVERLEARDCEIVARNWRCPLGELDVVARDAQGWLFVEVRTRRGRGFGTPEESLTAAKRRHVAAAALSFLAERGALDEPWRVELAAIELSQRGELLRVDFIPNVVTGADL